MKFIHFKNYINKKILFITPYPFLEPKSGGEIRIKAIYNYFVKHNQLVVVTRGETDKIQKIDNVIYNRSGKFAQIFNFSLFLELKKMISSIDLIFANTIWSGLTACILKMFWKKT